MENDRRWEHAAHGSAALLTQPVHILRLRDDCSCRSVEQLVIEPHGLPLAQHRVELLVLELARAVDVEVVKHQVDLGVVRKEVEAERADRAPKFFALDGPGAVLVPQTEEVDDASGRAAESLPKRGADVRV